MPDYENETCEGCRYLYAESTCCRHPKMQKADGWPDLHDRCDEFTRSLECRRVRALETIVEMVPEWLYAHATDRR